MASSDKRKSPRQRVQLSVFLSHPSLQRTLMQTRDISDSGLYIQGELADPPPQGAVVDVHVNGMLGDECPGVRMRVVRGDEEGVALRFLH